MIRFRIQHLSGARAGQEQVVQGAIVRLGRDPSCEVAFDPLADDAVSANHCQLLVMDDDRVQLADQGSSNGTFLNGERVGPTPVPVIPGAVIRLGEEGPKISLLFEPLQPAAAEDPAAGRASAAPRQGASRLLVCGLAFAFLAVVGLAGAALLYFFVLRGAPQ